MKRFTLPVTVADGSTERIPVYVGTATPGVHPLRHQQAWWKGVRGIDLPEDVVESFAKLADVALRNDLSFEDLCVRALRDAHAPDEAT